MLRMTKQILRVQFPCLLFLLCLFTSALADESVSFAEIEQMGWSECTRSDVRALRFIRVGEASLSKPDCSEGELLEPPMRLEFGYFRDVPGDAFGKAADNFLRKNMSDDTYNEFSVRFDEFNQQYVDIGDGDTYSLTYLENGELVLGLNGTELYRESGHEFAELYFTIWFGDDPYATRLKNNLLGR